MPSLYELRSANIRRTFVLVGGFLILVIGVGYAISWYFGEPLILYGVALFAILTNFYAYWASDKLVLRLTKARPASREEFFDLYTVTENLAITAGLPKPKLYVIDDPAPNAFATGRDEKHGVVVATTGLLAMLDRQELEGVIAHELSHIKNRDILVMTIAVVLTGFIAMAADIFLRMAHRGGGDSDRGGANAIIFIVAIVGIILAPLLAQLTQLAISRRREFLADASGALLTRYPEGLARALKKIGGHPNPLRSANVATAHLFIDDPFHTDDGSFRKVTWIERIYATHPPIADRIHALVGH